MATESNKLMIEFGLRRAQGPDGAMMATQYSYLGGFDGTSNVAGGKAYGIKVYGTMAHAYICSYETLDDIQVNLIKQNEYKHIRDIILMDMTLKPFQLRLEKR